MFPTSYIFEVGNSEDYFLENVYFPATKLELSEEHKHWLAGMLSYAEKMKIIRPGNAVIVKEVAKLRSEIRETRLEMQNAMISVVREINSLHHRVDGLEQWTNQAAASFQSLCDGQQQLFLDMRRMAASLQELHYLLKKQQRNRAIAGLLGFCLSMIPIVGGAISGAAFAASEITLGLNVEDVISGAKSGVEEVLAVDISSFQSVSVMMSDQFFQKLDPASKRRVETVVAHTEFKTLSNLQHSLVSAVKDLQESEPLHGATEDEISSELHHRFSFIASRLGSGRNTVPAQNAVSELMHVHQNQLKKGQVEIFIDENVVDEIVMKHMDHENAHVDFNAFLKSYQELLSKYPVLTRPKEPPELKKRFRCATGDNNALKVNFAKAILRRLFDESGRSGEGTSSHRLSFQRTKSNWNEEEVTLLLNNHAIKGNYVDEEGFVEVGMKVLFDE